MSSSDPDLTDLDTVFAPRIDDLVQSALENQSKEQRMMIDAVNAAKDALSDAKQDLSFLKERIQTRDTELMDVLDGRLSGLGREESITRLAERLEPVEHALNEVAERLEKIGDPLRNAVEDAIKTAFDRLDEMNSNFARALEGSARSVDEALRSMGGALDSLRDQTSQNASSMTELIEGSEGRTKELIEAADEKNRRMAETIEAAAATVKSSLEETARNLDETLSAKTNHLASELTSRSDALAAELTSRSDALADEMSSRSETLAAGITSRSEALADELRRSGDELVGRIDESQSRSSESLQQASGELKEIASKSAIDLNDALQASAARTFDRIQKLREDLEGYTKQLSDLPVRTEEQLTEQAAAIEREMAEARQTISQQLEAERKMMFERLDAHLNATKASGAAMSRQIESTKSAVDKKLPEIEQKVADRIEVIGQGLAEQMEAIRTTIDSEVPEMEKRMGGYLAKVRSVVDAQPPVLADKVDEVLGPVLSEMEKIGERFQNVNRRVTESNSRMEAMQEALIRYLAERDARLEEVRDSVLGDVIRQFSETLKPKDRTKISDALREAEQRRKDRRDADRYRKLKSKSPESIPAPEPPRELLEMPLDQRGRDSQNLEIDQAELPWEPATQRPAEAPEPTAEIDETPPTEQRKTPAKPKAASRKKAKTRGPSAKSKANPRAAATKPKPKAKAKSKPKVVAFETPPAKSSSKTVKVELPKEAPGGPVDEGDEKDQEDPTGSIPKSS